MLNRKGKKERQASVIDGFAEGQERILEAIKNVRADLQASQTTLLEAIRVSRDEQLEAIRESRKEQKAIRDWTHDVCRLATRLGECDCKQKD